VNHTTISIRFMYMVSQGVDIMKKGYLILARAPLLPIHAVCEFILLLATLILLPFIWMSGRLIDIAEKMPDMSWYKGAEYHNLKARINAKIKKRLKEKEARLPKAD